MLFWTIVVVSSRFHPSLNALHSALQPHQEALLTGNVLALPSLKGVHSVLIMCLWPNFAQSEMREPAWNLSGLAISMAMAMGLHTPQSSHEYTKPLDDMPGTLESRWMTWLMCFEVNTRYVISTVFQIRRSRGQHRQNLRENASELVKAGIYLRCTLFYFDYLPLHI